MANLNNITVNVSLNGEIDVDKLAEDFKASLWKEIKRVGIKAEVAKPEPLKVGDYAKVIADRFEYEKGNIVKIVGDRATGDVSAFDFKVDFVNVTGKSMHAGQTYGFSDAENLVKATDEEVANAKRQKAVAEKWAKIGRKPNEFKVGDIVRFTEDTGAVDYPEGSIAEITKTLDDTSTFRFNRYIGEYRWCELISPVESRFDRA